MGYVRRWIQECEHSASIVQKSWDDVLDAYNPWSDSDEEVDGWMKPYLHSPSNHGYVLSMFELSVARRTSSSRRGKRASRKCPPRNSLQCLKADKSTLDE